MKELGKNSDDIKSSPKFSTVALIILKSKGLYNYEYQV